MFELEYKITDGDMKAVNKSVMLRYFIPYLIMSLVGIGVGVLAAVQSARIELMICGIILAVFGGILLACSILMAVAPKNFVASILETHDDVTRKISVDERKIKISTDGQSDIELPLGDVTAVKNRKTYLLAYFGKQRVLVIKDAITSGQSLNELYAFISNNKSGLKAAALPQRDDSPEENSASAETSEAPSENTDGDSEKPQDDGANE